MKNEYEVCGDYVKIFLKHKGEVLETIIDIEDLEKVKSFPNTWCAAKQRNTLYVYGWIGRDGKQTTIKLHRFILNAKKGLFVDHKDKDGLNNRRSNLRLVTNAQNMQNVSAYKTSKSGIRGVSWHKPTNKWRAKMQVNGKQILVGYFDCLEEAEREMKEARRKYMPYSTN